MASYHAETEMTPKIFDQISDLAKCYRETALLQDF